ncbi:dimethylsulfonioproprionate lyase family protein [Streptomyces sp. DW26H14]|uniref:dimethylsulfonioproprionate lyase family protein n=1 Tax=Streptomyces sp. DW26H14 TaxID=3435395 RepID=UPI00403D9855
MVHQVAERLCRDVVDVVRGAGLHEQALALEAGLAAATAPPGPAPARGPAADPVAAAAEGVAAAHLPQAMDPSRQGAAHRLGGVLGELADDLRWTQTAAYVAAPPHASFLSRYAHATILGSAASSPLIVDPTRTAVTGVLLLGPDNHYPHHHHPADEVYIPLTRALWSSGAGEPYRPLAPGQVLHHRPGQEHAIRTGEAPLLALYLWSGDTTASARLSHPA